MADARLKHRMQVRLKELGWDLKEVSERTGDDYRNVQRWIKEDTTIPASFLVRFVAHVPVNPEWLMFGYGGSAPIEPSTKEQVFDIVASFFDDVRKASSEGAEADVERQMMEEIGARATAEFARQSKAPNREGNGNGHQGEDKTG